MSRLVLLFYQQHRGGKCTVAVLNDTFAKHILDLILNPILHGRGKPIGSDVNRLSSWDQRYTVIKCPTWWRGLLEQLTETL
jgi:hypothetical protein